MIKAVNTARGYSREPGPGTLPTTNHPQDTDPRGSLVTNHPQDTDPRGPSVMIKAANTARGYSREPGPGTLPTTNHPQDTDPRGSLVTNYPQDTDPRGSLVMIKGANTARGCSREPGPVPGRPPPITWRDSQAQLPLQAPPSPSPGLSSPLQSLSPIPDPSRPDTTTGCVTLCTDYLVRFLI